MSRATKPVTDQPAEAAVTEPDAPGSAAPAQSMDAAAGAERNAPDPANEAGRLLSGAVRRADREEPAAAAVVTGRVTGGDADGRPCVTWPDGPADGVPANAVWMERPPRWADCKGLRVALGFEDGDRSRPVVLGLLEPPPQTKPRTVRIDAGEELILECGESKILLRADGTIVILGEKVVSRARGVNKIRGGSVQIN